MYNCDYVPYPTSYNICVNAFLKGPRINAKTTKIVMSKRNVTTESAYAKETRLEMENFAEVSCNNYDTSDISLINKINVWC